MKFKSPTYGILEKNEVFNYLKNTIIKNNGNYKIIVGTDSQNTYKTKMVIVICLINEGKGGSFFYHIDWLPKIKDLNTICFIRLYSQCAVPLRFLSFSAKEKH